VEIGNCKDKKGRKSIDKGAGYGVDFDYHVGNI
jgi:hypothetical protein